MQWSNDRGNVNVTHKKNSLLFTSLPPFLPLNPPSPISLLLSPSSSSLPLSQFISGAAPPGVGGRGGGVCAKQQAQAELLHSPSKATPHSDKD